MLPHRRSPPLLPQEDHGRDAAGCTAYGISKRGSFGGWWEAVNQTVKPQANTTPGSGKAVNRAARPTCARRHSPPVGGLSHHQAHGMLSVPTFTACRRIWPVAPAGQLFHRTPVGLYKPPSHPLPHLFNLFLSSPIQPSSSCALCILCIPPRTSRALSPLILSTFFLWSTEVP